MNSSRTELLQTFPDIYLQHSGQTVLGPKARNQASNRLYPGHRCIKNTQFRKNRLVLAHL
ncbi:hypothetical protein X474_09670 [Dethiosulfatarculus sandiegensis]|uniref:Uncharacterized protein n=1 Tax=Dethiosulfatarculus sandiegensis TaxID=1429043 RepID=A0A0D2GHQ4_9BACT|nr:hypothetical protein X474_09670 [Dethiosulfatarculus sandiegensis]